MFAELYDPDEFKYSKFAKGHAFNQSAHNFTENLDEPIRN